MTAGIQGTSPVTGAVQVVAIFNKIAGNLFESLLESLPDFPYPSSNEKHSQKAVFFSSWLSGFRTCVARQHKDIIQLLV